MAACRTPKPENDSSRTLMTCGHNQVRIEPAEKNLLAHRYLAVRQAFHD
jgi:hypothetical protein